MVPFYKSEDNDFILYNGETVEVIQNLNKKVDMIFADPPYFLSNGGISYQSGQIVNVNKGEWDKSKGNEADHNFNMSWLKATRNILKDNGTIWISGTYHNIFSIANCLTELGYKILNVITWAKTNPPPNISCRFFTYSSEFVIWARKYSKKPHYYNYELMKKLNGNQQMTDVWRLPAIAIWEKRFGKHPTQKPLKLLHRIILASTKPGELILDPFTGSSTTGIAANLLGRNFIGIDKDVAYLNLSINRKQEIASSSVRRAFIKKLYTSPQEATILINHARRSLYNQMIQTGICYLRAGDSQGSILIRPGFEHLEYVLIHTAGEQPMLFKLKSPGKFKIWTKETLEEYGFSPEHAKYYVILQFDKSNPIKTQTEIKLNVGRNTYTPKIVPYSELLIDEY